MIILYLIIFPYFFKHLISENATNAIYDEILDITVNDNTIEIDRLLYGDITRMDDLYLPSMKDIENFDNSTEKEVKDVMHKINIPNSIWDLDDLNFPNVHKSHNIKEFNDITKSVRNITKTIKNILPGTLTRRYWYQDYEDGYEEYYSMIYKKEPDKKNKLMNLMITFLIHARYQIKKGLKERQPVLNDKRYKIGYLFNRLRVISYEQKKLVSTAHKQRVSRHDNFYSILKLYEKVVRGDVDVIDTIKMINALDQEKDIYIPFPRKV